MKLIGLIGLAGSGKDTVAKEFIKHGCIRDSFAAPLKEVVCSVFGWPLECLEGDTEESRDFRETEDKFWSITPRAALQRIGTDVFRNHFSSSIWLDSLEYRLRKNQKDSFVIITDVRFVNEAKWIKKMHGDLVWIRKGELPEWFDVAKKANHGDENSAKIMQTKYSNIHISEWNWVDMFKPDHIIVNDGNLSQLYKKSYEVYNKIFHSVINKI